MKLTPADLSYLAEAAKLRAERLIEVGCDDLAPRWLELAEKATAARISQEKAEMDKIKREVARINAGVSRKTKKSIKETNDRNG